MKRTEKWYQRRLAAYCEKTYGKYEDEIEFYPDPDIDQWEFYIPSIRLMAIIFCDENGTVYETHLMRGDN